MFPKFLYIEITTAKTQEIKIIASADMKNAKISKIISVFFKKMKIKIDITTETASRKIPITLNKAEASLFA